AVPPQQLQELPPPKQRPTKITAAHRAPPPKAQRSLSTGRIVRIPARFREPVRAHHSSSTRVSRRPGSARDPLWPITTDRHRRCPESSRNVLGSRPWGMGGPEMVTAAPPNTRAPQDLLAKSAPKHLEAPPLYSGPLRGRGQALRGRPEACPWVLRGLPSPTQQRVTNHKTIH